jgi:YesN/AraC family two-component response regulator
LDVFACPNDQTTKTKLVLDQYYILMPVSEMRAITMANLPVKKILAIASDARERLLFLEYLKAEGFLTIGAEDGLIGMQQAREQLPDLIICDPVMSQPDGYSLLTMLRQDVMTMTIPVIFIAAKVTHANIRKGMELGADDYLVKPLKLKELLKAIAARLERQEKLKQGYAIRNQQRLEQKSAETNQSDSFDAFFPCCPKLSQVFDFIEANYHQAITLHDVAKAVGYSKAYLTDLVKRQTGETVQRWIIKRRIAAACSLLLNTDQSVNQIAETVGYNDTNYFFYQFRQHYAMTPQTWRNTQRTSLKNETNSSFTEKFSIVT